MKYGILFLCLSSLIAIYSCSAGSWWYLLMWPAISCATIATAYLGIGHRVFGKRSDGSMAATSIIVLLPYLLGLWSIWHIVRLVSREALYGELHDGLLIGRRLLTSETPCELHTVVDLTCEFAEPNGLRSAPNYLAVPMLDASSLAPDSLVDIAYQLVTMQRPVLIHCAQGHGRTGLVAALVLIARGIATDPDDALQIVKSVRPLVGLNNVQQKALAEAAAKLQANKSNAR